MFPVFGAVTAFRPRGTKTPDLILGERLDLPTEGRCCTIPVTSRISDFVKWPLLNSH